MESLPKTQSSLFSSSSLSCETHKNTLEFICLNQQCLEKGSIFCCGKCLESHHKEHRSKLIKLDLNILMDFEVNTLRKSDSTACLASLNELRGKIILILNTVSKSMAEKCQTNQKLFFNSFERFFLKLSKEACLNSGPTFLSFDFSVPKMDKIEPPFFSKNHTRNSDSKANQYYREFAKKFEKFKKLFASLIEQSNKFYDVIQEFNRFMDESYNNAFSESTNETDKRTTSSKSLKTDPLCSIFETAFTLPSFHQDEIFDLKFLNLPIDNSKKISCLASCSKDKSIHIFDLESKKLRHSIDNLPHIINQMAFSEEANLLAASLSNDIVKLWRYNSGFSFVTDLKSHSDIVWGLQFLHSGTKLVSSSFDSSIRYWDLDKNKMELKVTVPEGKLYGLVYMEDMKLMAVAGQKSIFFFDERDPKTCKMSIKNAHENQIIKLDYSTNYPKNYLASCSKDNKIKLWDICKKDPIQEYSHDDYVYGISFLNPRKLLASASDDRTIKIWNVEDNKLVKSFEDHTDFVKNCQWNKESQIMASAGKDKNIVLRYF